MATAAELEILHRLERKISARLPKIKVLDAYYQGARRLQALGLALPPGMEDLQTIVNWPGMYPDALNERLVLDGWRLGDSDVLDTTLWGWWRANGLPRESRMANLETLVQGRSYLCVGFPESSGDAPVITAESGRYMAAEIDPVTHRVAAALRLWDDNEYGVPQRATLYLPDATSHYGRSGRGRGWVHDYTDEHGLGQALVAALVNRARLTDRDGVTQMRDIMGLADAACRTLTNLQAAQEILAVPSRYILGADGAVDEEGNPVPEWEAYIGRYNTVREADAKVVQLPGADLGNFTRVMEHYARLAITVTGLPAHYFGLTTENPASADAIRAGEARLVKQCEDLTIPLGDGYEQAMRLAMLIDGRSWAETERVEAVWRDPATPTYAARADATTKLVGAGILPVEAAWEDLGYSEERRRRLRGMMSQDPMERYAATMAALDRREQARAAAPAADAPPPVPAGDGAP